MIRTWTARRHGLLSGKVELYEQLGIADKIVVNGIIVNKINFFKNKNHLSRIPVGQLGREMSAFPYVLILPQDAHEKILVNELKSSGHDVRWNHELKSFRDDGDSVEAVIENENGTEKKTFAYMWL